MLWCRCESEISVKNSFIGGVEEGPGYCVNCQDHARVTVEGCHLERSGGEYSAAVAIFHNARLRVQQCNLQENQFAFRAVTAKDVLLELVGNTVHGDLWYDSTRPGTLVSFPFPFPFPLSPVSRGNECHPGDVAVSGLFFVTRSFPAAMML